MCIVILRGGPTIGQGGGGALPPTHPKKKKASVYIYIYVEILNFGPNSPPIK